MEQLRKDSEKGHTVGIYQGCDRAVDTNALPPRPLPDPPTSPTFSPQWAYQPSFGAYLQELEAMKAGTAPKRMCIVRAAVGERYCHCQKLWQSHAISVFPV